MYAYFSAYTAFMHLAPSENSDMLVVWLSSRGQQADNISSSLFSLHRRRESAVVYQQSVLFGVKVKQGKETGTKEPQESKVVTVMPTPLFSLNFTDTHTHTTPQTLWNCSSLK